MTRPARFATANPLAGPPGPRGARLVPGALPLALTAAPSTTSTRGGAAHFVAEAWVVLDNTRPRTVIIGCQRYVAERRATDGKRDAQRMGHVLLGPCECVRTHRVRPDRLVPVLGRQPHRPAFR